ncbi:LexA/Signal peptidase [Meredithblackwellia eburnea MCA 4105]
MQPTLNPDSEKMTRDIVILNKWPAVKASAGASSWKVGDIVAVVSPLDPQTLLMKRIIGLPGSLVQTRVPAHLLSSPTGSPDREKYVRVPQGRCWLEGDSGFHSRDSNDYGPVPLGLLKARVEWIVFPPSRFGKIATTEREWEHRVIHPRKDV